MIDDVLISKFSDEDRPDREGDGAMTTGIILDDIRRKADEEKFLVFKELVY